MEKWAKTLNAQKESQSVNKKMSAAQEQQRKETASADAGFAMLEHVGVRQLTVNVELRNILFCPSSKYNCVILF